MPPLSPAVQQALKEAQQRAHERGATMTTAQDVLLVLMGWKQERKDANAEQPST